MKMHGIFFFSVSMNTHRALIVHGIKFLVSQFKIPPSDTSIFDFIYANREPISIATPILHIIEHLQFLYFFICYCFWKHIKEERKNWNFMRWHSFWKGAQTKPILKLNHWMKYPIKIKLNINNIDPIPKNFVAELSA